MVLVEESVAAMARLEDLVTKLKRSCPDIVVWHRRQKFRDCVDATVSSGGVVAAHSK